MKNVAVVPARYQTSRMPEKNHGMVGIFYVS